jgi:hypothetical protein
LAGGAIKTSLLRRVADSHQKFFNPGGTADKGQRLGHPTGLIEPAPTKTLGVEGHRNEHGPTHEFAQGRHLLGQHTQIAAQMPAGVIFQLKDKGAGWAAQQHAGSAFVKFRLQFHAFWAAPGTGNFTWKGPTAG